MFLKVLDKKYFHVIIKRYSIDGACRQAVKTSDCGSDMHGFESHQAPHLINLHSMNNDKNDLEDLSSGCETDKDSYISFSRVWIIVSCVAVLLITAFLAFSFENVLNHLKTYSEKSFVREHKKQFSKMKITSEGPDFGPYMGNLQNNIKANWNPPKYNESKHVMLLFTIAKNGDLLHHKVLHSSGDSQMDNAAVEALLKTAPFEPLPEGYNGKSIDIQFTFDYNVLKNKAK